MQRKSSPRLSPLQLAILQTLWQLQEATVAQVLEALPYQADLAYTTVATMLRRLEERKLVTHREDGRTYVYQAVLLQQDVAGDMAKDLIDRLFEGSLARMVSHLLTSSEISSAELAKLEKLLAQRKNERVAK
jgi:BlaI family penicillinase repressor